MRIVGGILGGRVLRAPAGAKTRPTSEKVREAVFNILGNRLGSLEGAYVLDLFAGSGALGIEALSRGAERATFVDAGKPQLGIVKENLKTLALESRADVIGGDAVVHAARIVPGEPWRLVFVDPPYQSNLATRAVLALPRAHLAPGAIVVVEHDRPHAPPDTLGTLLRTDQRRYGDTMVSFFEVAA
ncbi:MAG: 16S rRNA (guanine(966)-N(2))-methyltransferase RsmD [Kofleriaceae bacterium]|nr:16S rRNA (guanine(966)-N(2))-methyltransferase RsmD [Kofleriaceae bacterium]